MIGVGINLMRAGVLGGDVGIALGVGGLLASATSQLGGIEPYHYFDFVNNDALYASEDIGTVSDPTGYSFSRASGGYYTNSDGTLTSFGSGELRRGDRGVLIEGARTNLLLRSQEFDNMSWAAVTTATVTANAIAAPDGTLTADLISAVSSTFDARGQAITVTAATVYSVSVFIKQGTATRAGVSFFDQTGGDHQGFVQFDWTAGVPSTAVTSGSPSNIVYTALADGWYRLSFTVSSDATNTAHRVLIYPDRTGTTGGTYFWGAQLEAASHVSSYIPTTSASATRAADVLTYAINSSAEIAAAVASETELVSNGGFDSSTNWTLDANATISGGKLNVVGSISAAVNVAVWGTNVDAGWYAVTYTIESITGAVSLNLTASVGGTVRSSPGTYTDVLYTGSAGSPRIQSRGSGVSAAVIDNVSVKAIPANSLTLYPSRLFAEFERAVDTGTQEHYLQVDAGSNTDRSFLNVTSGGDLAAATMIASNVSQADLSVAGALSVGVSYKAAGRFSTNSVQAARDGTLGTEDTVATAPASPTAIRIGVSATTGGVCFGYIYRIAIIQGAGSDADLTAMTS